MMSKISKKTKTRGASSEQIKPVSFHFKFEHSARIMFLFFWFKHVQPTIHNHTRCFARIVLYSGHLTVLFSFKKIRIFHRLLLSLTFWLAIFHLIQLLALLHLTKKNCRWTIHYSPKISKKSLFKITLIIYNEGISIKQIVVGCFQLHAPKNYF